MMQKFYAVQSFWSSVLCVCSKCLSEAWVMNYWNSPITLDVRDMIKNKARDMIKNKTSARVECSNTFRVSVEGRLLCD